MIGLDEIRRQLDELNDHIRLFHESLHQLRNEMNILSLKVQVMEQREKRKEKPDANP